MRNMNSNLRTEQEQSNPQPIEGAGLAAKPDINFIEVVKEIVVYSDGQELVSLRGVDEKGNTYTADEYTAVCGANWVEVMKNEYPVGDVSLIPGGGTACGHGAIETNEEAEKIYYTMMRNVTKTVYKEEVIE